MTTAPWVGRALTGTLPAKDLTSLVHWNQKHEGEPMKQYSVHTKAGVVYHVEARSEVDAWSVGLDRIFAARDNALLPIVAVTEDEGFVDDDGDGDGQAGMCIYGCTDYHLADCPTRDRIGGFDTADNLDWED